MLPGVGRGADDPARGAAHLGESGLHRPGHHRHAGQPADLGTGRPGARTSSRPFTSPPAPSRSWRASRAASSSWASCRWDGWPTGSGVPPIIGWATFAFGLMVFASGLAMNIFVFFLARFGAGISQSSTNSVHGSLLADTYPISVRGRLYAAMGMCSGAAMALSPLLVGLIATQVGGPNGWRWAFYILAIPILLVAIFAFRIPEPPRGQFEKKDVLGEVFSDTPSRRAVARGGVRADHAHPHDQDGPHRLLGDRVRAVHGPGARQPLPQATLRPRRLPARASSAPSAAPAS